jgi:hypothetical protein
MKQKPTVSLRRRRKTLLHKLPPLEAVLRGSLIERYKRCGKPGCKCAGGPGHGPKYYLSVSKPGIRPQMDYVPQDSKQKVEEYLANYRKVKIILEELCEISRELLRRREKF